jgi:hypothetical protein
MLNIWTLDFSAPFIVTRFIYLAPPNMIFIIYNSTPDSQTYARAIYNELPSNITKKYAWTKTDVDNAITGYTYYKIICFNECPVATPPNKYSIVSIRPSIEGLFTYGKINYTAVATDLGNLNYIGKASLFGAIFSDNAGYYKCQMDRSFKQFRIKATLQTERLLLLQNALGTTDCSAILTSPLATLTEIRYMGLINASDLYVHSIELKNQNTDMTFKGCPLIY